MELRFQQISRGGIFIAPRRGSSRPSERVGTALDIEPASPERDVAAWRRQRITSPDILTPDLAALAQSGVSVTLGARRMDGRPIWGTGVGCRILADGTVRIGLDRAANAALLQAMAASSALAATFTGAPDHRAFQIKARRVAIRDACSSDLPEFDRQCALLRDGLIEIGFAPDLAASFARFDPDSLAAVELRPERVFTQTPGPGAGAELDRRASSRGCGGRSRASSPR